MDEQRVKATYYVWYCLRHNFDSLSGPSRKHLRRKVTPDFHLTYSKNGGNQGSESK